MLNGVKPCIGANRKALMARQYLYCTHIHTPYSSLKRSFLGVWVCSPHSVICFSLLQIHTRNLRRLLLNFLSFRSSFLIVPDHQQFNYSYSLRNERSRRQIFEGIDRRSKNDRGTKDVLEPIPVLSLLADMVAVGSDVVLDRFTTGVIIRVLTKYPVEVPPHAAGEHAVLDAACSLGWRCTRGPCRFCIFVWGKRGFKRWDQAFWGKNLVFETSIRFAGEYF